MNKAILHIDGDSFFASCEVALNPKLKGRPVITGQERGIATAMSKEAKALGIYRGMPVFKIKKLFPEVIICQSDYGVYEMFSQRFASILRRFTHKVEEYSIDECFADLTGLDKEYGSYEILTKEIKNSLQTELGLTFSLGLARTKVLAKVASKKNKPDGLTLLLEEKEEIEFLKNLDIGAVWGIGPATSQELKRIGINTALDLRNVEEERAGENFHKGVLEIYYELNGTSLLKVNFGREEVQQSIQATRTFSPPTTNKEILSAELSKNMENASVKARSAGLVARRIYLFLKTQEYRCHRHEVVLPVPTNSPVELMRHAYDALDIIYRPRTLYRASGVTLAGLVPYESLQNDLFGSRSSEDSWKEVIRVVDTLDKRYGTHSVVLGSSLEAFKRRKERGFHKRLNIPYMGEVN